MQNDSERNRILELRRVLHKHNYLYYTKNKEEITDQEYDLLYDELIRLEKKHPDLLDPGSPTLKVGAKLKSTFEPVRHRRPMLSLEKASNDGELSRYFARCQKAMGEKGAEYLLTPKIDGLAVSLRYVDGKFVQGTTRGDGEEGEDISANLRYVIGVLPVLPGHPISEIEVRGEVYMSHYAFENVNKQQREIDMKEFANPRNAAAGTIRQKDVRLVASRELGFFAYWAYSAEGSLGNTAQENYEKMCEFGFEVSNPYELVHDMEGFKKYQSQLYGSKDGQEYDIDGIVIRLNDTAVADGMGRSAKSPKSMLAYKFQASSGDTTVEKVEFQISRTGAYTPVAKVAKVKIGGVNITSVTLHNCMMLKEEDLLIGDTVTVIRAGDVIPKIVNVHKDKRQGDLEKVKFPAECAYCNTKLQWSSVNLICPNEVCKGRLLEELSHFVSRQAMDIDHLGKSRLELLIKSGDINRPSDIFGLKKEQLLLSLEVKKGEKMAENIEEAIDNAKDTTLDRVLNSLGMEGLGLTGARALAECFGNLEKLSRAMPETICFVGPVHYGVAVAIHEGLNGKHGDEINRMKELGVHWEEPGPKGISTTAAKLITHINYLAGVTSDKSQEELGDSYVDPKWLRLGQKEIEQIDGFDTEKEKIEHIKKIDGLPLASKLIDELESTLGITWEKQKTQAGPLAGKAILVTGTIEGMKRDVITNLIKRKGGTIKTAVTKNLDLLVTGENPGKAKVDKAAKLNINTIDSSKFLEMLGNGTK